MTQKAPLSRDDPISTLVARCFQSFVELDAHISSGSQSPSKQMDEDGFLDELGRLRVWAANIGAHRTGRISLDFRLRDAPHIRTQIQGLLYDLEENIRRTSDIISGASLPWDKLERDSDSDAEFSESELSDEEFGGTEQEQLKNSIHETITLLSRLSMAVRNPAMHDRHINSSQLAAVTYSKFDVDHVSNKFPHIPSDLANNLGKAISRRRQYLHSRKERHEKLAQGLEAVQRHGGLDGKSEALSESMAATSLPEAIKSMSQEDLEREPYSDSEASHTSFARSNFDDGERQKIPPFPREGAGGTPFECPICFMMISVHSQESWKRHVFRDIHPYVCTFPDCTTPQRLFSRRREWFLHELEMHRCHWQCAHGCGGDFKTASQFEDHVIASHPESASPGELAKLSSASSRPMSQRILVNCSMCGEKDISLQKLKRHLGRHQEDLALFAMPFTGYELEENATEETGSFEENASIKSEDSVSSSLFGHEDDRQKTVTALNATNDDHKHFREGEDRDGESEVEGSEFVLVDPRHSDIRPVPLTLGEGHTATTDSLPSENVNTTMPPKPSMAYTTTARAARWPDSRGEKGHLPSSQTHDDSPREPPGPPDFMDAPPSSENPSRRRSRRPPPIVTQPVSHLPNNEFQDRYQNAIQTASDADRESTEKFSALLNNLYINSGNAHPEEMDDERQFWAHYHRDRQKRREEGRKMNEQSRPADDWEARLEEGRRRLEQEHRNRQQETRHDPSIDDPPAKSLNDEDWEAQLKEGRRRLAELRRTEKTAANRERRPSQSSVNDPLRRRNTASVGSRGQRHRTPRDPLESSYATRSNPPAIATASSSIGADTPAAREAIERNRLLSWEREQMARERQGADAMLASQIADAQADIQRAEARIAARRDREHHERMAEGEEQKSSKSSPPTRGQQEPDDEQEKK